MTYTIDGGGAMTVEEFGALFEQSQREHIARKYPKLDLSGDDHYRAKVMLIEGNEYVRVTFPEKPDREVLDSLRAAGFRWGAGSWVGRRDAVPASVHARINSPHGA